MDIDELVQDISDNYPKKNLLLFGKLMGIKGIDDLKKEPLTITVTQALLDRDLFYKMYNSVSDNARKVLYYLTWYGVTNLRNIESFYKIKLTNGDYYGNSDDPFIQSLKPLYSRDIMLSSGLRYILKKHLDFPPGYNISYNDKLQLDASDKVVEADDKIISQLDALLFFSVEEKIHNRGIEKKLLKKTINKAITTFNITEPFLDFNNVDKDVYIVKTTILLKFISMLIDNKSDNPIKLLKDLLKKYSQGSIDESANIDSVLFYPFVKGAKNNYNTTIFLKRGRYAVLNLIKSLEAGRWVSIENAVNYLSFREETEIFNTIYFGENLSVKVDYEFLPSYHFGDLELLDKRDLQSYLITPLVKGIVMLLHSIGAVDITASYASIKVKQKVDKYNLTPFDLVSAFRITPLGSKLFGKSSNYVYRNEKSVSYKFLEDKTIILNKGNDPAAENFFNRIGKKIGENDYIITPASFIKECSIENDITSNINRLKSYINCNNTTRWDKFISDIESRINPIYNEQELIVVNVPIENRDFVSEVINNPLVSNLYTVVEGGRLAFNRNNLNIFKKKMKKIGYLIE